MKPRHRPRSVEQLHALSDRFKAGCCARMGKDHGFERLLRAWNLAHLLCIKKIADEKIKAFG